MPKKSNGPTMTVLFDLVEYDSNQLPVGSIMTGEELDANLNRDVTILWDNKGAFGLLNPDVLRAAKMEYMNWLHSRAFADRIPKEPTIYWAQARPLKYGTVRELLTTLQSIYSAPHHRQPQDQTSGPSEET